MKPQDILFKAKTKKGYWIEGYFAQIPNPETVVIDYFIINGELWEQIVLDTLCQYVGRTDKNGVKIFEGDYNEDFDVVHWCDVSLSWQLAVKDFPTEDFIFCHCYNCEGNSNLNETIDDFVVVGNINDAK